MIKTGKQQNLRRHRLSIQNAFYFITTCIEEPSIRLDNTIAADIIFDSLKWLEEQDRADIWMSMVMPDHIHLVLQLKNDHLSSLMNALKGFVSRKINQALNRKGSMFQKQYYEHCVRRDEDLQEIIRYCFENPIRKGLVDSVEDYPFWRCKFEI